MDFVRHLLKPLHRLRRRKQRGLATKALGALLGVERLDVGLGGGGVLGDVVAGLRGRLGILSDLALLTLLLHQGGGLGHLVSALHHEAHNVGQRKAHRYFDPPGGALLFEEVEAGGDAGGDVGGAQTHAGGLGGDAEAAGGVVDGAFNDARDDCDLRIGG